MTIPLIVLAFLSAVGGFIGIPESLGHYLGLHESNLIERWLQPVFVFPPEAAHTLPHLWEYLLMILSLAVAIAGCWTGYLLYSRRKDLPNRFVEKHPRFYQAALEKFYVDEVYQKVFVRGLLRLNDALAWFDLRVIDGLVNLSAEWTRITSFLSGWFDRTFVDGAVNLTGSLTAWSGARLRRIQTGRIQMYLYYVAGGVLVILMFQLL